MITVSQLIEKLKTCPQDSLILIWNKDSIVTADEPRLENYREWNLQSEIYLQPDEFVHVTKHPTIVIIQ